MVKMYLLLTVFSDLWSESEIKEIYLYYVNKMKQEIKTWLYSLFRFLFWKYIVPYLHI